MGKKGKPKQCHYCNQLVTIRYRIQYEEGGKWCQVCCDCWDILAIDNPFYRYGGTWKAK